MFDGTKFEYISYSISSAFQAFIDKYDRSTLRDIFDNQIMARIDDNGRWIEIL
jgi:hypothetical protein